MGILTGIKNRKAAYRNPVYITYSIFGVLLFVLSMLIVKAGTGKTEEALFRFFNYFGHRFEAAFVAISILGSIGFALFVGLVFMAKRHYAGALKVFIGSIGAYITAYGLKQFDFRARPGNLLEDTAVREASDGTLGFPSGHAAIATVLAIILYQYLPKRWHRPITILAVLVMISRLYLGVHLPLDLVGGFAIGIFWGGLVNFTIGSRKYNPVAPKVVKQKLKEIGYAVKSVTVLNVDARGSTPYYAKIEKGDDLFIKIVGKDNNIADWLFKTWRKIIYRRLEDETPFLNPKRQLEHEAYVSGQAVLAGIRSPRPVAIFETDKDRWAFAQTALEGKSLDSVNPKSINDSVIKQIWVEIDKMHNANIIHRDLRCANIFLDSKNRPWIIDFGFAEASMPHESKNRDRAELLCSLSTLIGVERAVKSALGVLSIDDLKETSQYLSYAIVSSATTKELKKQKGLLDKLHKEVVKVTKLKKVKPLKIQRVSLKGILMVSAVLLGFAFMIPRIDAFGDSLSALRDANYLYVILGAIFSFLTYVGASFAYKALAFYPISFMKMLLIEIASSFASKLAPAGAGGLAVNTRFLTKNGHNLLQAGSIAGINNIMGFVGHMSLLIVAVMFSSTSFKDVLSVDVNVPQVVWYVAAGGLFAAICIVYLVPAIRKKIIKIAHEMVKTFAEYREHPSRLFGSYISSVFITLSYVGALYVSSLALGADLSPLQILLVFTVGITTASVTPTPGGIGGAEAGLTAALTATGLPAADALSITLLYRLLTYWLPILPGFIAFQYAAKKEYI